MFVFLTEAFLGLAVVMAFFLAAADVAGAFFTSPFFDPDLASIAGFLPVFVSFTVIAASFPSLAEGAIVLFSVANVQRF